MGRVRKLYELGMSIQIAIQITRFYYPFFDKSNQSDYNEFIF